MSVEEIFNKFLVTGVLTDSEITKLIEKIWFQEGQIQAYRELLSGE